jgi:hypothetical protein
MPSSGTNRMQCTHMAIDTSQATPAAPDVEPCLVVRCGI